MAGPICSAECVPQSIRRQSRSPLTSRRRPLLPSQPSRLPRIPIGTKPCTMNLASPPAAKIAGLAAIVAIAGVTAFAQPAAAQSDSGRGTKDMGGKGGVSGVSRLGRGRQRWFPFGGHGASLRMTQLTRDQIRMTIQCGRPGTPMPHFDRFAYTDKRCYDMTAEDLGDTVPNRCRDHAAGLRDRCAGRLHRGQDQGSRAGDARCNASTSSVRTLELIATPTPRAMQIRIADIQQ